MKLGVKIALLMLVLFPIWLTIVAFAGEDEANNFWKDKFNSQLLQYKNKRVQISDLNLKKDEIPESLADTAFDIDLSGIRDQGISPLSIKFFDKQGRLIKLVKVHAKLFIQEEVAVAVRVLSPGEIVSASDFAFEWRDSSTFRGILAAKDDIAGRPVRATIQTNEIIQDSKLQRNVLVNRGDRVRISVVSDGILISSLGIAQEPGTRGQTIRIINSESRKEIYATVTDSRSVELKL